MTDTAGRVWILYVGDAPYSVHASEAEAREAGQISMGDGFAEGVRWIRTATLDDIRAVPADLGIPVYRHPDATDDVLGKPPTAP